MKQMAGPLPFPPVCLIVRQKWILWATSWLLKSEPSEHCRVLPQQAP